MGDRSNGKWKDPVRLPIIEDRQGDVRRRPSERDRVLLRHSPTAVRRNGKDHPKHHVSPKTTLTGSHRRIHGRQTSLTDRVGRFDAPSRTECGHGIVIYTGMSPPQTERRVHHTEHFPQRNEIENHRIKHDISRHDEKRKGRVSCHHAGETTLSWTLQDIGVRVRRRHCASVRIPGHGHVTSLGRHLQIENTRSQTCIRGRTRDGREKMSRLLEQQDHLLELLRTTRKLQRQALLRTIDKSQLKALSEIIHNVIKGSIILSPSDKNRLKKYKKVPSVLGRMSTKRRDKLKALQSKTTTIVHLLNVVSSRPWRK